MIVVNRFESGLTNRKINTKVPINQSFMMNNHTFQLAAAICHFGVSSTSGHYTSSVFYTNVAYVCNDQRVYSIDQIDDKSDSVYLLFYRCDDLN